MEIRIKDVESVDGRTQVTFEAACGAGRAFWQGPEPVLEDTRFVELELRSGLRVGQDLIETAESLGLRINGNSTVLVGEITLASEDGYCFMRLGKAGIGIEVAGTLPVVGGRYRIHAPELQAFDEQY